MSRVVVTGGAGRLGRSVVRALVDAGHEVTSLDAVTLEGLPAAQERLDLLDAAATSAAFSRIRPDAVVHLAAIAVPGALPDPEIFRVNTQLVFSVLQATLDAGAGAMLLASSPTVMGYGAPRGWAPEYLPLDEAHPTAPWNGYGASKVAMETIVQMAVRQHGDRVRFGVFRPCYVIAPEEWEGAPTQQGHTVEERLADPALSAVALFNYVDARDAGEFVAAWLAATAAPNGATFFVGAPDALYDGDTADAVRAHLPALADVADQLPGTASVFSSDRAAALLGWRATRLWRDQLVRHTPPLEASR
ncbi:NAD-dependent epimerase/dehydratase family protein [Microbacterium excoecariae]|uniref:NAD-dependent epimerase/dehydratase family protein n=1 Tax=Microbacterium excoecariae TaxID=2715210 RepID=UPI00140D7DD3|nr:NAD(P)-dependent oxidoreductase [Microbacterium excoecariae]NHI17407.1 NAD(P)-dependent oxidoreductase [Microbacterium excoecariae]